MVAPPVDLVAAHELGMTKEDFDNEPPFLVWPDNVRSINVFSAFGGQWRYGPAGRMALDMNVLPEIWTRTNTEEEYRDDIFRDLAEMEAAALEIFHPPQPKQRGG